MTAAHAVTATFLPPLAPPACKVPKVVGKTLATARTAITKAHCKVGKVTRKTSSAKKKGKVIGQTPKAGKTLKNGAKVNLTVGKGPAKKKK
jgi:beta-lactam-binding protein with PASTA domain